MVKNQVPVSRGSYIQKQAIPQTKKIGNITLTKGQYLTLMKQKKISQSCHNSPHVYNKQQRLSIQNAAQNKVQSIAQQSPAQISTKRAPIFKKIKKQSPVFNHRKIPANKYENQENQIPSKLNQSSHIINPPQKFQKPQLQLSNQKYQTQSQQQPASWHQISKDKTLKAITVINTKKKTYNRFNQPTQLRGLSIKFLTPEKKKFWAFNCFYDRDLQHKIDKEATVEVQVDNDQQSDDEQMTSAIKNMFYSLCIAIHEEKQLLSEQIVQEQCQEKFEEEQQPLQQLDVHQEEQQIQTDETYQQQQSLCQETETQETQYDTYQQQPVKQNNENINYQNQNQQLWMRNQQSQYYVNNTQKLEQQQQYYGQTQQPHINRYQQSSQFIQQTFQHRDRMQNIQQQQAISFQPPKQQQEPIIQNQQIRQESLIPNPQNRQQLRRQYQQQRQEQQQILNHSTQSYQSSNRILYD